MYADAQVQELVEERGWSVVTQMIRRGEMCERGVTADLTLFEAMDYARDIRLALRQEGWRDANEGGLCRFVEGLGTEAVYIFVDESKGEDIWHTQQR